MTSELCHVVGTGHYFFRPAETQGPWNLTRLRGARAVMLRHVEEEQQAAVAATKHQERPRRDDTAQVLSLIKVLVLANRALVLVFIASCLAHVFSRKAQEAGRRERNT